MDDESAVKNKDQLKESLETQLSELEMLQSMFYNPGEIHLDDPNIIEDMNDYIKNRTVFIPTCLDFTINLLIETLNFELCVTLPHDYPEIEPDLFVRNSQQNREQQRKLNNDLRNYVKNLDRGIICIYSIITWLQEHAVHYVQAGGNTVKIPTNRDETEYARYWIYSHHIYSKTKRREMLNLADEYKLSGFCLPGKPGIVCIEGLKSDCNNWWMFIKSMNWKRIVCKLIEKSETDDDLRIFRKFKKFVELSFHCEGIKANHMDMGELLKYLEEHDCAHIFKELFGLDGKSSA